MKKYIGWIIVGTLVLYLMSIPAPFILALPTLLGWLVPVLMWPTLGKGARNQALLLLITGGILVAFAAFQGVFLGWQKILAANLPLLAMFVAVSFLALTNTGIEGQTLPQGKRAVAITAFGTHLLGAIINLSVLFVFGDRLRKNGILTKNSDDRSCPLVLFSSMVVSLLCCHWCCPYVCPRHVMAGNLDPRCGDESSCHWLFNC